MTIGTPIIKLVSPNGAISDPAPAHETPLDLPGPPQAGDCTTVNNHIDPTSANAFVCVSRLTVGAEGPEGAAESATVLPDGVECCVLVDTQYVVYQLTVKFTNPFPSTAAALLEIPRLPGLLLFEEKHRSGTTPYDPKVMEKEQAEQAYAQAAASSTHSATLSSASEDLTEVKLDKIPANETAEFSLKFIQQGVREVAKVVESGDNPAQTIADVLVVPGFTCLEAKPVPFALSVLFAPPYALEATPTAVLAEDTRALTAHQHHIHSLLAFSPEDHAECQSYGLTLSCAGFSTGTAIKARLARPSTPSLSSRLTDLSLSPEKEAGGDGVVGVNTASSVMFDPRTGSPQDVTNVEFVVPAHVPGVVPSPVPHDIYIIVDTSGSTSMRVNTGQSFLETCKAMLTGIVTVLPRHIDALQGGGMLSTNPITVRMWSFDSDVVQQAEFKLTGSVVEMEAQIQTSLVTKIKPLRAGGWTDFDSWSALLLSTVSKQPQHKHHVLLLTDGGATSQDRFQQDIQRIRTYPSVGFFQCDALGYGPWLNPQTVSFLADTTDGEAILVEQPTGEQMQTKVLGMLARSLLRAASAMTLRIHGGAVLALHSDTQGSGNVVQDMLTEGHPFTVEVTPGTRVRVSVLHAQGQAVSLAIASKEFPITVSTSGLQAETGEEWDMVNSAPSHPSMAKLQQPATQQALHHLLLLEPAYAPPSTSFPSVTTTQRLAATLAISLRGQVMAPSVTRGCAVATLETELKPVPMHCEPKSPGKLTAGKGNVLFADTPPQSSNILLFSAVRRHAPLRARAAGSTPTRSRKLSQSSPVHDQPKQSCNFPESASDEEENEAKETAPVPQTPTVLAWLICTKGGMYYTTSSGSTQLHRTVPDSALLSRILSQLLEAIKTQQHSVEKPPQQGTVSSLLEKINAISRSSGAINLPPTNHGDVVWSDPLTSLRRLACACALLFPATANAALVWASAGSVSQADAVAFCRECGIVPMS